MMDRLVFDLHKPSPLIHAVVVAIIFQKRQKTNPVPQNIYTLLETDYYTEH